MSASKRRGTSAAAAMGETIKSKPEAYWLPQLRYAAEAGLVAMIADIADARQTKAIKKEVCKLELSLRIIRSALESDPQHTTARQITCLEDALTRMQQATQSCNLCVFLSTDYQRHVFDADACFDAYLGKQEIPSVQQLQREGLLHNAPEGTPQVNPKMMDKLLRSIPGQILYWRVFARVSVAARYHQLPQIRAFVDLHKGREGTVEQIRARVLMGLSLDEMAERYGLPKYESATKRFCMRERREFQNLGLGCPFFQPYDSNAQGEWLEDHAWYIKAYTRRLEQLRSEKK